MGAEPSDQIINDNLPAFLGGVNDATFVIIPPREIHNLNAMYVLNMQLDTTDATHYEGPLLDHGPLPPPGQPGARAATFNDVPTNHPFFQFIEALAASGITAAAAAGITARTPR
jgi:hypothetical protein